MVLCLMVTKMHATHGTVLNILVRSWEIYYSQFDRFMLNTRSIFEFFLDWSEFRQKFICTIISVVV